MKLGWQTKALGDVCDVDKNQGIYRDLPYVGLEHIESHTGRFIGSIEPLAVKSSTFKFSPEHLLYGRLRPYLNKVLAPDFEGHCSTEIFPIKPRAGLMREFLQYWFFRDATVASIDETCTGARMPRANVGEVMGFEFPLPPLPEQQRIVGILDEAFEGIAAAKANAEKNLQNARALFESHLQSVFTQRGKGWVESTIGETCTLRSGTTVSPTLERPIGDIPYLKVADMTFDGNEDQITTSSRFLCEADVREGANIPKGATIFPKRGGAILTNKKRITSLPICADLNIMAVIPSSQIDAGLLYFYFLNVDMKKLGTGSSIPQINNYDVAPLLISFPKSLAIQAQIVSKLDALREETKRLATLYERKLAALEALKKSLLHQAFTGELTQ